METLSLSLPPLPCFSRIQSDQIESTIKQIINQNRAELKKILDAAKADKKFTWANIMQPLEEMYDQLAKVWAPISHLHAVMETESLRAAYKATLPFLTEYHTELMQNETLFAAIQAIADSYAFANYQPAQRKYIQNEIRDFKLAGVALSVDDKKRFGELQKQLSKLTTQFAENILDATQHWTLLLTDPATLQGLPEESILMAEQTAKQRGKTGWLFTLEYPTYSSFMKYCADRSLRKKMYEAYVTRASDQGPDAGRWDNTSIIESILRTRYDLATLLGFKNYAEDSLATKMADTPERVLHFLNDLVTKSKPSAKKDVQELYDFANQLDGLDNIEAWDFPYYTEKLRIAKYDISQETLRAYFPANHVLKGMFQIVNKLYGLNIIEHKNVDVWHPQVQFFEVRDENNKVRGYFYTDLYARPHKRDGAWMDDCQGRRRLPDGHIQHPIAFLTCNFNRPLGDNPALLTHEEVLTLFHEFGHCLHHMLTQVDYLGVSGINGVAWDAVEFPSQFFEHWCWEEEALGMISKHYMTGEPLPHSLYQKLIAAKNFQSGMQMLRQLEFALFDFKIHLEYNPERGGRVQQLLDEVRKQVAVLPVPSFNRFQNSFSHIFAGGYAAGYYSYKWAEVLSSDAFSKFEETGIFNADTGREFLHHILEQGGTSEPMELFVAFRGREPSIDALLKHSGLM